MKPLQAARGLLVTPPGSSTIDRGPVVRAFFMEVITMSKEIKLMNELKKYAIQRCNEEFGLSGCAEGKDFVIIHSGDKKKIIITITLRINK